MTGANALIGYFEEFGEAQADRRGRVTLARTGARSGRRYRVHAGPDGLVVLEPVVSIPRHELLVWQNPELAAQIREGVAEGEAARGADPRPRTADGPVAELP